MIPTKKEFELLMKLFIDDRITREQIVIPMQSLIQANGFLDDRDELVRTFANKFHGKSK